ncbi:MAG: phosphoribosylaminoimidazolecarboxamide formyltransferase / IMP cyclohydrolase [Candidatus Tokpelaia sp. JSC161]|jgi:phosphoribosylaminoimidazolecarboxamide formyltransferase/IMP cyclohydrolase|nr:MAG: phosphoribosylaminoimidazolecarboxamide formyltransferase / IMP cyclohydrolase [Candidatus Tokpelaia sp. JSC161]
MSLDSHIEASDIRKVHRVLISVFNKKNLIEFSTSLVKRGAVLISTGGTARSIMKSGLQVETVSEITRFPEIMEGRVKTLHPAIHGALLAKRDDPKYLKEMNKHGIQGIDLLVVNLYPFEEICISGADMNNVIENIDIGGPAMIRAAAKNHAYTAVVTDPDDYEDVLVKLDAYEGGLPFSYRRELAARAFARTAAYDAAICNWFSALDTAVPLFRTVSGKRNAALRYGENPHQTAGFYLTGEKRYGVGTASVLQGKKISYNNISDADTAFELVAEFNPKRTAAVAIVKHANPCGVAEGETVKEAYLKALASDPVSAFGSIVALNRDLDLELAREIIQNFVEVIIAPSATSEARVLIEKKRNLRLLLTGGVPDPYASGIMVRSVASGFLVQSRDNRVLEDTALKVVTKRQPTLSEIEDLKFAFCVVKHVKSNAIVYAKNKATLSIGAGQMSRIDSARLASQKCNEVSMGGCVAASDAFFPFSDGLLSVIEAGVTAVIQPGGSVRDEEVITLADANDITMVFSGIRHFKH